VKFISGSIHDLEKIKDIITTYKVTHIIHLASNLIPSSDETDFQKELAYVIAPTFKMIDLIKETDIRFIFFSSGGTIYGKTSGLSNEDDQLEPITLYGYSKLMVENYIRFRHRTDSLKFIILRPSNVYGRYQKHNRPQGFIAVATSKMMRNQPIEIWGDGMVTRDYIDVEDVSQAVKSLLLKDIFNITVNISSGLGYNLKEIIHILETALNKKADITFTEKRNVDVDSIILDNSKIKGYIRFNPKAIKAGIENFIATLSTPHEK
jgi:UDP-glucose 4-epimerase